MLCDMYVIFLPSETFEWATHSFTFYPISFQPEPAQADSNQLQNDNELKEALWSR